MCLSSAASVCLDQSLAQESRSCAHRRQVWWGIIPGELIELGMLGTKIASSGAWDWKPATMSSECPMANQQKTATSAMKLKGSSSSCKKNELPLVLKHNECAHWWCRVFSARPCVLVDKLDPILQAHTSRQDASRCKLLNSLKTFNDDRQRLV